MKLDINWGHSDIDKSEQIVVIPFGEKQVEAILEVMSEESGDKYDYRRTYTKNDRV